MTIPNAAMPVVAILRDKVDKPEKEELSLNSVGQPRFRGTHCPLGLLPGACMPTPFLECHVVGVGWVLTEGEARARKLSHATMRDFFEWWDCLTINQARDAVDEIWNERMQHDSGLDSGLTEDSTHGSRGAKAVG